MKKEDFVKTVIIDGVKVDIGIDDYGQCYYFEYMKDGKMIERSCGTYNTDYMEEVVYMVSERYRQLYSKEFLGTLTDEEEKEINKYRKFIKENN